MSNSNLHPAPSTICDSDEALDSTHYSNSSTKGLRVTSPNWTFPYNVFYTSASHWPHYSNLKFITYGFHWLECWRVCKYFTPPSSNWTYNISNPSFTRIYNIFDPSSTWPTNKIGLSSTKTYNGIWSNFLLGPMTWRPTKNHPPPPRICHYHRKR